jgi:hypothetical protein
MASTSASSLVRYKFVFFTPPQNLSEIKAAIFATGAGTFSNYSECCFTLSEKGQFRPGDGASPAIGTRGSWKRLTRSGVTCSVMDARSRSVLLRR